MQSHADLKGSDADSLVMGAEEQNKATKMRRGAYGVELTGLAPDQPTQALSGRTELLLTEKSRLFLNQKKRLLLLQRKWAPRRN